MSGSEDQTPAEIALCCNLGSSRARHRHISPLTNFIVFTTPIYQQDGKPATTKESQRLLEAAKAVSSTFRGVNVLANRNFARALPYSPSSSPPLWAGSYFQCPPCCSKWELLSVSLSRLWPAEQSPAQLYCLFASNTSTRCCHACSCYGLCHRSAGRQHFVQRARTM
jgi:hypothetical protein